jgi:uncharacterized protein YecE (DUF72 family)
MHINVGTAGWTIPRDAAAQFPAEGTALERYSARFPVAEINSSFHRPHRASTWERWRDSVPATFRFAVKVPKTITHQRKLVECSDLVAEFLAEANLLGDKLAVLLVQLPPKLAFDADVARSFFGDLRERTAARIACEPRNASWFEEDAEELLDRLEVARVAADPAICDAAARPGGWSGLRYWRLHGSPAMYRSSYGDRIGDIERSIRARAGGAESWCIFDNTASGAATSDALALAAAVAERD